MNPACARAAIGAALLIVGTACVAAPVAPAAPARAGLTVVSDDDYPPYVFRQADGRVGGYLVDAWALWERKTGVPVHLVASDWGRAKTTMAAGGADVIDTVFKTPEREQVMDFTPPYADLPVPIYVHHEIGGVTSAESLKGFLVAAKTGDACVERLQASGVSKFELFASYAQIVEASASDKVRIFCMDEPPANYLLYRAGLHREFRKAFVLYTGQFHRAVRKGDAATLALVQRGFDAFTPAEAQALRDKWMGTEIVSFAWARSLGYGLAAATLAAALMLVWGMALRRLVRRRTAELLEQRQRLRTLVDTLPDLVWLKDLAGRYVVCNTLFERYCGAKEAQIVGRADTDIFDADMATRFQASDREAVGLDGRWVAERWLTMKDDGRRGLFETVKSPMRDAQGRVVGVLGIARDVTQHREAQDRLQRLNRLYRVVNAVGDTIALERDRAGLFDAVCRIVVGQGGLRMAWIGELEAGGTHIHAVARAGVGTDYLEQVQIAIDDEQFGHGPTGTAYREGRTVSANDLASEPNMRPWLQAAAQRGYRASAAFPIKVRGTSRAVLSVYSDKVDHFDDEELKLLERTATGVGIALEAADADTARSRAEAGLRASEERFALMFRTSPVGMALGRLADGSFLELNDVWLSLFGYSRQAVIGRNGLALGLWHDPAAREHVMRQLRETGRCEPFDTTMRASNGRVVDISFAGSRIDIGAETLMLGSFVDVSLRSQAAKSLEEQAEQLELMVAQRTDELNSVFQALPDLYFRIATDGTIRDYRAGRMSDLLLAPEHFLGRRLHEVLPPDVGSKFDIALARLDASNALASFEFTLPMPSGEIAFEARLLPFRDGEVIVVVRNISDRAALERAQALAREESQRLTQLRSEFLANMSHEIRTPLNGIMGLAQIGAGQAREASVRGTFDRILDSSRLLLGIVNDVLDFSKIDANRLDVESVPLDPRALVASAVDGVREVVSAKGLALTVQVAKELPEACLGDPLRLKQILLNLLTNAVKFTPRGHVGVWAGREDDTFVVRISDTGIGISPSELQQLFVPFQQADSSTTRKFGGTGLGLSISRRLARLMGGDIEVQSELTHGSVFTLRLPLVEATPAPAHDAAAHWRAGRQRLAGLSVLVVEDNTVNQIILEAALSAEGADVEIADDGQIAVDRVRSAGAEAFDLVLMDLQMPVMDGYEATQRLREMAPGLPVVGQTAHALSEERGRCLVAGMVAHVAKPIDLEELVATVREHARVRRAS